MAGLAAVATAAVLPAGHAAIGAAPVTAAAGASPVAVADPAADVAPSRAQERACFGWHPSVRACNAAALADIDRARRREHLGPLRLPAGYGSMGLRAQVLAVANAERTSRHLPPMPQSSRLDGLAQGGVATGGDPLGPAGFAWGSNYAVGEPTALSADFAWMYDDGLGSPNLDCTRSDPAGCWGHRNNILLPGAGRAGAGVGRVAGQVVFTELFVDGFN